MTPARLAGTPRFRFSSATCSAVQAMGRYSTQALPTSSVVNSEP